MSNNLNIVIGFQGKDHLSQPVTKLQENVKELTDKFQQAQSKLKALNALQGKINNFKRLTDAIKKQGESINKTTDKLTAQNKKLKELHDKRAERLADIKKLRKDIGMAKDPMEYSKLNAALTKAHILYEKTRNDVREHNKKIKEQESTLKKLRHEKAQNIIESRSLNRVLKESGVNVKKLEHHESELAAKTMAANRAVDKQKQSLAAANQKLAKYNHYLARQKHLTEKADSAKNFGIKSIGGAVGLGLIAKKGIVPGIDFEKQMSAVQAKLRLDKTSKDFKDLVAQAKELGATTSYTAQEVGAGQEFLAMAGFKAEAIKASMGDMLNLAKASNTDLAQTADIASNIAGAFKVDVNKAGEMTRVADILAYTTTSANVDMQMLGDSMKYLAQAKGLNLSLEQAAAMAGMLGNVGIQGTQAGTTLSSMLNRLSAPATEGKKAMEALGLTFTDTGDNAKDFVLFLEQVAEKTKNLGNAKKAEYLKDIFGKTAVSGMTELVNQAGEGKLKQYVASYKTINGSAAKMAKTMADNVSGELDSLNSAFQGVGIELFQSIADDLRKVIKWFTNLLRVIGKWAKEHKEQAKLWLTVAGAIAAVIGGLGSLALLYSFLISPIVKVIYAGWNLLNIFSKLIPVIIRLSAVLLTNPFGLIVVAIAAVVGAIYLLWNKCDWFRNSIKKAWNAIANLFKNIWATIKSYTSQGISGVIKLFIDFNPLGLLYRAFAKVINWLGGSLPTTLSGLGAKLFDGFSASFSTGWNAIVNFFGSMGNSIISFISGIWESITSTSGTGITHFLTYVMSTFNPFAIIYNAFAKVINWLGGDLPETLAELGAKLFDGMAEGIKNAISGIGDSISNGLNSAIDTVGNWFSSDDETTTKVEAAKKIVKKSEVNSNIIAKKPNVTIDKRTPIRAKQKHQTVNAPMTNNLTINVENGDPKAIKQIVLQTFQELQLKQQAQARAALVDQY